MVPAENNEKVEPSPLGQAASPPVDAARPDSQPSSKKAERPDKLPDDFWNDETGVDVDRLVSDHAELRAFKAQQDSRAAQVPEKPENYKAEFSKDFKTPEGVEFAINEDDPRMPLAREYAHKRGMSQQDFSELMDFAAQLEIAENQAFGELTKLEHEKLGTRATARVNAATQFLIARYGDAKAKRVIGHLATADGVEILEDLIKGQKGGGAQFNGEKRVEPPKGISDEEYDRMSPTQQLVYAREHSSPTARVQAAGARR